MIYAMDFTMMKTLLFAMIFFHHVIIIYHLLSWDSDYIIHAGWWLSHPSEKYELVSWDD